MKPETSAEHIRNALQMLQPELLTSAAATTASVNGARRRLWLALASDPVAQAEALQGCVHTLECERARLRAALTRLRERDGAFWARRLRAPNLKGRYADAAAYMESLVRKEERARVDAEAVDAERLCRCGEALRSYESEDGPCGTCKAQAMADDD